MVGPRSNLPSQVKQNTDFVDGSIRTGTADKTVLKGFNVFDLVYLFVSPAIAT